jgi:Hemerythrin HHE cation binding domain
MADIIEVILADHKRIRRMLGALDDAASYGEDPCAGWMLAPVWCRLADLLELHAEAEEEICYLALFGQGRPRPRRCRTRSPTMTTSARRYGKRSARRRFCSGGERSPPPRGPAVTMLPVSSAVPWRLSAAAPLRRCAMSFAAGGPRSSRPAPVTQHRKRESATALPGEPGQARPVTAPFTTHPADLAATAEGVSGDGRRAAVGDVRGAD